ncbi:MAG: diguanylate cyclase [Myxococcota bacterium]
MGNKVPREGFHFDLKRSIATDVARLAAFVGLLFSVIALVGLFFFENYMVKQQAISEARLLSKTVASLYQIVDGRPQQEKARDVLLEMAHVPGIAFVDVLNTQGQVTDSTHPNHVGVTRALTSDITWEDELVHVTHVSASNRGDVKGVRISLQRSEIRAGLLRIFVQFAMGFTLVIAILAALVLWVCQRVVVLRLMQLAGTMQAAEKNTYVTRATVDRNDEIGLLSAAFNHLLETLTSMKADAIQHQRDLQEAQRQLGTQTKLEKMAEELSASNQSLKRHIRDQELLMRAVHELGATLNKDNLLQRLVQLIHHSLGRRDFAIFLLHQNPQNETQLQLQAAHGWPQDPQFRAGQFSMKEGAIAKAAQTKQPVVVGNLASQHNPEPWYNAQGDLIEHLQQGSMLAVPMLHQETVCGVMAFFDTEIYAFDKEDQDLLAALAAQAAMAFANARLYEETLEMSTRDPLTGVDNRRALLRCLREEIARCQRFALPLSLLMIDVDDFKVYNDHQGHVLGDEALKQIAQCLQKHVRQVDRVARYGGEEFCVVLPQTSRDAAAYVAGKLCKAMVELSVKGSHEQPKGFMSISVGVAQYPEDVLGSDDACKGLFQAADQALYQAKQEGRNCVRIHKKQRIPGKFNRPKDRNPPTR